MNINHLIAEYVGLLYEHGNVPEFISNERLHEILADVRHDPVLIDHHASVLFPKQPKHRLAFRRAIRSML